MKTVQTRIVHTESLMYNMNWHSIFYENYMQMLFIIEQQ